MRIILQSLFEPTYEIEAKLADFKPACPNEAAFIQHLKEKKDIEYGGLEYMVEESTGSLKNACYVLRVVSETACRYKLTIL
jgi:hypothetical protein